MKLFRYLIPACIAALVMGACAKPDEEFVHDDPTISAIYISPAFSDVPATVSGQIDQQTGKILFPISKSLQSYFDIRQVKVRANVGYDVRITPLALGHQEPRGGVRHYGDGHADRTLEELHTARLQRRKLMKDNAQHQPTH